jgi:hypothetical protein
MFSAQLFLLRFGWADLCDSQVLTDSRRATAGGVVRLILGYQKSAATPTDYCAGIIDGLII